jgi:hypothetical protein
LKAKVIFKKLENKLGEERITMKKIILIMVVMLSVAIADRVFAFTVTETNGDLSAQVTFDINASGNLVVTLTNSSTADVTAPIQVLTGVFFNVDGNVAFTPVSAVLAPGSTIVGNVPSTSTDPAPDGVGGEWAYANNLSGAPGGDNEGISSTGLGLFGSPNFGGANLQGPNGVDGLQYGITSAGDDPTTGNGGLLQYALIQNSVIFTLSGVPTDFDLASITNIKFQYGTSLTVPEPSSLLLLGSGLMALGLWSWTKKRKRSKGLLP